MNLKIVSLALFVFLIGCHTPMIKKEGTALGFQRAKADDPDFLKATYGEKDAPPSSDSAVASSGTPASPAAVGATSGAVVAGVSKASAVGKALTTGVIAPPVVAVGAVVVGAGAATAELISALTPDTDCGDGWALFTLKTAEGEIRTIRQARRSVCEYKNGDSVQYMENETGILILKKPS